MEISKKFLLIAGVLLFLTMISIGVGNERVVTITPRDTQSSQVAVPAVHDTLETIPPETSVEDTDTSIPEMVTFVLNKNTKKFHLPDCASVAQMKEKNRVPVTGTRDDILAMGYTPCHNCNP